MPGPSVRQGWWCSVLLAQADEDEDRHRLQPCSMVCTDPGGRQGEMGQKQREKLVEPLVVLGCRSLALVYFLHGYEGQCHRKRGALACRALDVNGPMVG